MRVLIVSDTHGRHTSLDRALKEAGEIDMFIHLGDVEGGEDYIEAVVGGNLPLGKLNVYAGVRFEYNRMELVSHTQKNEESPLVCFTRMMTFSRL